MCCILRRKNIFVQPDFRKIDVFFFFRRSGNLRFEHKQFIFTLTDKPVQLAGHKQTNRIFTRRKASVFGNDCGFTAADTNQLNFIMKVHNIA